jgi:hypothetical protein
MRMSLRTPTKIVGLTQKPALEAGAGGNVTTADERRALTPADLYVVEDPPALLGRDDRPEIRVGVCRISHANGAGARHQPFDDRVMDVLS